MKRCIAAIATCLLAGTTLFAQPVIDGNAEFDALYGGAQIVTQDTNTGFGNSNLGQFDFANGSELDGAYGVVYGTNLYLLIAGNLETNGNKMELFFDSIAGGQNQLIDQNPDVDFNGLNRMGGDDPNTVPVEGLKFASGFEADYYITLTIVNDPAEIFVSWAELADPVDPNTFPGQGAYLGRADTKCVDAGGEMSGVGDPNDPNFVPPTPWWSEFKVNSDNSNVDGVDGGAGLATGDPNAVTTGIELCIPLAALGNPTGNIDIAAFVNGQQHDFLSNQALGGFFGAPPNADANGNPGEPRNLDLSTSLHMPFSVTNPPADPMGACCVGLVCSQMTATACAGMTGTYLGDNVLCAPDICDIAPVGGCCVMGECSIQTETNCNAAGGSYLGDGTDCSGCCPQTGACCDGETCTEVLEADCEGDFLGEFTTCGTLPEDNPCLMGACCDAGSCTVVREDQCTALYLGDGTDCTGDPCNQGACCVPPDNFCFVIREVDCAEYGGTYLGDFSTCPGTCNPPTDVVVMDGQQDVEYGSALSVQAIQTQFGDNSDDTIPIAGGSELDAAYAYVSSGRLQLLFTGNLETNFNKLEIFFDTIAGGQNVLGNSPDPGGPVATMDGMTFDVGFEADYWLSVTTGGAEDLYLDWARLYVDPNDIGEQYYVGNGRSGDITLDGFLFPDTDPNSTQQNPSNILCTYDNSNVFGVTGGTAAYPTDPNDPLPEDVTTGIEISIPLAAIGATAKVSEIKICAFINGSSHDFASNQWLGPLPDGTGNLTGDFPNIDLSTIAGDQFFTVGGGPAICVGDLNCNGSIGFDDINPFVDLLVSGYPAWQAMYPGCPGENGDINLNGDYGQDGSADFGDINPFVDILTGGGVPIPCP